MATKTTRKPDPAFTAAIAQLRPALAAWRQRRKHREPIPKALWREMVTLAREYGLSPVSQALSVNYTALKGHLAVSAATSVSGGGSVPGAFVEVPLAAWPATALWIIELEDRCGSKLTLRLAPGDRAAVLALAQGLWGHRA